MLQSLRLRELITDHHPQLQVLAVLSLSIVVLTAIAHWSDRQVFERWLGQIHPLLASVVIVLVGGALLGFLLSRGWFSVYRSGDPGRFLPFSALAVLLAIIMILVDRQAVLPENLNVLFPQSVPYYPVVGYAAEILFHVLPLTVLLFLLTTFPFRLGFEVVVWPAIVLVLLAEPVFQVLPLAKDYPAWVVAVIAVHLWIFNLIQLGLFKRYDFVTMYAFRLAYYLVWHVIWGYLRLGLLF